MERQAGRALWRRTTWLAGLFNGFNTATKSRMRKLSVLLFVAALWHVGTAWFAGSVLGLDLIAFLAIVAIASVAAVWAQRHLVSAAELETEMWSIFGYSITRDVILSLITVAVSSLGFYWVVLPRYGWDGYLAAVAVSYGASYGAPWLLDAWSSGSSSSV